MFKLVIVEDEDNIRHSLECFIPWEEIGFQVVATFSDGSDALAYLQDDPCDAVLTDILMSRMSGLEMTRRLHVLHPEIKVVILSGHSNFAYAQEAIQYKVEHYLVKPVDEDELIGVFRGIREQLAAERDNAAVHTPPLKQERSLPEQSAGDTLCQRIVSDYRLLSVELDLGSQDTLVHILNGILHTLENSPLEDMRFILKNLYSAIALHYEKRKIGVSEITGGKFTSDHLDRAESPEAIATCLVDDFCALCQGMKKRKQGSDHSVIGRLVEYLDTHLDEDIRHDEIATRYRIHPGYLSRLFKQEMGETLSEYLLRVKIEKAAQLLKEGNYKIGEIAAMMGYSTSSYFSIMFKKYTGHSPREYSQRVLL